MTAPVEVPPAALHLRVAALERFLAAAGEHVPEDTLVAAHTVVERAGQRLALSRDHTVVALAGSTGSGKSSLFNTIVGADLSAVDVRRPATTSVHACVWGPLDQATGLLDWLGVLPQYRFTPAGSTLDGDADDLSGLVLLDLPDLDSVELAHRAEADRLLGLVDLVVWVVDPQKYADSILHDGYLRRLHAHQEVTVVALNQADRLSTTDIRRCLTDLRGLLDEDRLAGVPAVATSATGTPGHAELRTLVAGAVADRQTARKRLASDVREVVADLSTLVGPAVSEDTVDRSTARMLTDALASAAGVPAVVQAASRAYRQRAGLSMGWPVLRWVGLSRRAPLDHGRPDQPPSDQPPGDRSSGDQPTPATPSWDRARFDTGSGRSPFDGTPDRSPFDAIPERSPFDPVPERSPFDPVPERGAGAGRSKRAAVALALRAVADQAAGVLPTPWPAAISSAARAGQDGLPGALDRAVTGTDLGLSHTPAWWRAVAGLQLVAVLAAVAGLVWLIAGLLLGSAELTLPIVLLAGGLGTGLLLALLSRPLVGLAAKRASARAQSRLRAAIAEVGREHAIYPVRLVLHAYSEARAALIVAGAPPR